MVFHVYLLNVCDLEEESLKEAAMTLLDSYRKELVHKYKKEKDRMRAIAAGLLLQIGFLEMEPPEEICQTIAMQNGKCHIVKCKELVYYLRELKEKQNMCLPLEVFYAKGAHGKPYWSKKSLEELGSDKKMPHFNLSHSGDYAVLAIADIEVGIDIQEARETKAIIGGYKAFSRMEAYVKCTGEGYGQGSKAYQEKNGAMPQYQFLELELVKDYALNLCYEKMCEHTGEYNEQ